MKEELSTKQHSEFSVSEETERKHTAWSVLDQVSMGRTVDAALQFTGMKVEDLKPYLKEFNSLFSKKVVLE